MPAVQAGYALAEVPCGHDAGAGQQPADPLCLARRLCTPRVRRTGLPWHTPVGNGLDGDTFWLVAAHGMQAGYVCNLQAEPRVRVKADGLWHAGTAVVLPGDDPAARSRTLPHQWDAAIGRMMASAPLTIRIDLDPRPEPK